MRLVPQMAVQELCWLHLLVFIQYLHFGISSKSARYREHHWREHAAIEWPRLNRDKQFRPLVKVLIDTVISESVVSVHRRFERTGRQTQFRRKVIQSIGLDYSACWIIPACDYIRL